MTAAPPGWLVEVPFAHRGLHGDDVAENSLEAFAAAAEAGYGIELDVRCSVDGCAVVVHDEVVDGLVVSRTPAATLRERAGVPTLSDALEVVAGRVPVMVEVKNPSARVGPTELAVAAVLDVSRGPVTVASFNPATLGWFRRHLPHLPRGLVAAALSDAPLPGWLRAGLRRLTFRPLAAPHYVSYALADLPNPWTDRWRARGRVLLTWTVRTIEELERARTLADNIIFEHIRP